MYSHEKCARPCGWEVFVRLSMVVSNAVAMGLSLASGEVIFIILGSILAVSTVFNLFTACLAVCRRLRRSRSPFDDIRCPSLIILAIDTLGVMAFLVLYVCATIETANAGSWSWKPVMQMTYASIGGLVASVMHGFMVVANLRQYIRYRQSLGPWCPHCHQAIGTTQADKEQLPVGSSAADEEPLVAAARDSFSANSNAEGEGDVLIMKT